MEKVENFAPKKIGWGLIYGIVPCWMIEDDEATPTPVSPMIMGGFISEGILAVITFFYNCLISLYNHMSQEEIDPMFAIWLSPKTKKEMIKRFGDIKQL